jgi:hypothetical protein
MTTSRSGETSLDLEKLTAKDVEGADVALGDLWRDHPAVLVFLRHYG